MILFLQYGLENDVDNMSIPAKILIKRLYFLKEMFEKIYFLNNFKIVLTFKLKKI